MTFRKSPRGSRVRAPFTHRCQFVVIIGRRTLILPVISDHFLPTGASCRIGGHDLNRTQRDRLESIIAGELRAHGRYVAELDAAGTQHLVDAQWAAHSAGRAIGARVTVARREERNADGRAVIVLQVTRRSG